MKITPDAPKNESGLILMIIRGRSIRQIWVKMGFIDIIELSSLLSIHQIKSYNESCFLIIIIEMWMSTCTDGRSMVKTNNEAAPVAEWAEWLRSLTSVLLIIRSSHRCGFAPRSGRESHVGQAKFCLRVCQVVFPRVLRFSPHLPIGSSRYE